MRHINKVHTSHVLPKNEAIIYNIPSTNLYYVCIIFYHWKICRRNVRLCMWRIEWIARIWKKPMIEDFSFRKVKRKNNNLATTKLVKESKRWLLLLYNFFQFVLIVQAHNCGLTEKSKKKKLHQVDPTCIETKPNDTYLKNHSPPCVNCKL